MFLGSSSVGENASLRLLRLLLLDLGNLSDLAKKVGENVLGGSSDVNAVVRKVFPAEIQWERRSAEPETRRGKA